MKFTCFNAAFNAFLKTLEEPPSYAIFILAPRKKHKVIPTILSRCQIFDFNRIQISDIANHLKKIASARGIPLKTSPSPHFPKGRWALRDALSIFDTDGNLLPGKGVYLQVDAKQFFTSLDYDYYFQVVDALSLKTILNRCCCSMRSSEKDSMDRILLSGLSEHLRKPSGVTGFKNGEPHGST
jgi:DNA polymerase-3 subunit gamma/tau